MTEQKIIDNLLLQAERDYLLSEKLFKDKDYTYSLFFGQQTIEKILKALVVKKKNVIYPPIHSLVKLIEIAGININSKQIRELEEISSFNIEGRYDDIKFSFYKKATKIYTKDWFNKIKEYRKWFLNLF